MKLKMYVTTTVAFLFVSYIIGQNTASTTITFKKGEVLDVLLLTSKPDSEDAFKRYKETAFPVALEYSYAFKPGFKITKPILSSSSPKNFVFGSWASLKKREEFISNICNQVPDFHEQRLATFNHFKLTYYEVPEDLVFSLQKEKKNVVTSFWKNDDVGFLSFISKWKKDVHSFGGRIILNLTNGKSPVGYAYNPELLLISEWDDMESLEKFVQAHPFSYYSELDNVEQFIIE